LQTKLKRKFERLIKQNDSFVHSTQHKVSLGLKLSTEFLTMYLSLTITQYAKPNKVATNIDHVTYLVQTWPLGNLYTILA